LETGYILGLIFFHVVSVDQHAPQYVWVIVGDIRPAFFDAQEYSDAKAVLRHYIDGMKAWVDCASNGQILDTSIIQVNVPPTREWAKRLQTRLTIIEEEIMPYLQD
jgi:hypothetical protein